MCYDITSVHKFHWYLWKKHDFMYGDPVKLATGTVDLFLFSGILSNQCSEKHIATYVGRVTKATEAMDQMSTIRHTCPQLLSQNKP